MKYVLSGAICRSLICISYSWICSLKFSSPNCKASVSKTVPEIKGISCYLRIVLADAAVFVARDDIFVQEAPGGHCSFALLTGNLETELVGLICQIIAVSDIVNADRPE